MRNGFWRAPSGGPREGHARMARSTPISSSASSTPAMVLAWLATYAEAIKQMAAYAERLTADGRFGEMEALLDSDRRGRIRGAGPRRHPDEPVGDGAASRPRSDSGTATRFASAGVAGAHQANSPAARARLVELIKPAEGSGHFGESGVDETLEAMRGEMRRFVEAEVKPYAHQWHMKNEYIPLELIGKMNELGVFGLTIPEEFGGLGLGKEAMCVVSEELSRGYIGVGSLGTRSEIAAELILGGGTQEQKERWLPKLASGEVLPTAVFTEPNTGSDLASLKTRAVRDGDVYRITGQKTWITHPVRADLMTRADAHEPGRARLSRPVDVPGREAARHGRKSVPRARHERRRDRGARLSRHEGIRNLLRRLRGARLGAARRRRGAGLQAAHADLRVRARANGGPRRRRRAIRDGPRRCAMRTSASSSARPIVNFPRVSDKIAMMAAETMIARQLTYFAAREKDGGRRCDLEAGMAKLLAARVAWAAADSALQIHGGNGFALEYPISRVLCDARILSIFEGAAEIQAQVIARRLLEVRN